MTDRELLELAAKAAGIELKGWTRISGDEDAVIGYDAYSVETWNPLTDDGDALRLSNKLRINIQRETLIEPPFSPSIHCGRYGPQPTAWAEESEGITPDYATRRAITRAAAAIGEAMK